MRNSFINLIVEYLWTINSFMDCLVKYNEISSPNEAHIIGFIKGSEIKKYPIKKNKGVPYYEVPIDDLKPIESFSG